jgi:hypothetical protein
MNGRVSRACGQNPRCTTRTTRGMKMCSHNAMCGTRATEAMMIMRDTASAPKDLGQNHSEAPCVTRASQSIFDHQATLSSTTAKPSQAFGWRTTTFHAGQVGWTMIFFIIQFLPSTLLTQLGPGGIVYQETSLIAGRISRRSS